MGFYDRQHWHDNHAIPVACAIAADYGFIAHPSGVEMDSQHFRDAIRDKIDDTSLQFRYRPDRLLVHSAHGTLMYEIKCEYQGYKNFAVEFRSYATGRHWAKENKLIYAFADIDSDTGQTSVTCCEASQIEPKTLLIPDRWDADRYEHWLLKKYPDASRMRVTHNGGSGTPYFLIPKSSQCLLDAKAFFRELSKTGDPKSIHQSWEQPALFRITI